MRGRLMARRRACRVAADVHRSASDLTSQPRIGFRRPASSDSDVCHPDTKFVYLWMDSQIRL